MSVVAKSPYHSKSRYRRKVIGRLRSVFRMKLRLIVGHFVAAAFLCLAQQANSCSWAVGYFYQVKHLRGIVVGTDSSWLRYPRWVRQRAVRPNVNLRIYKYHHPSVIHDVSPFAKIKTDKKGRFDFGVLPDGHYTLVIDWPVEYGDLFDVEVKPLSESTSGVKIDISPADPACRGGHEITPYSEY